MIRKHSSITAVVNSRSSSTDSFKSIISTSPYSSNLTNFEVKSDSILSEADFLSIFDETIQKVCDSFKQNKLFDETQSHIDLIHSLGTIVSQSDLSAMLESRLNEHSAKNLKQSILLYEKIVEIGEIERHHVNTRALKQFLFCTPDGERWKNMFIKPFNHFYSNTLKFISNDFYSVADSNLLDNANPITLTEKLNNFMTNIAKTEETLKQRKLFADPDNILIKKVNVLFEELDALNNKENEDFMVDLCLLAFNYLAIAKALLDTTYDHSQIKKPITKETGSVKKEIFSTVSYKNQLNTLTTPLRDKDPIQFSFEPILHATPVDQFNKNIISLKIKQVFEENSDCLKLKDNQKTICTKCGALLSIYSKTIGNQWHCVICEELNTTIVAIIDKQDVEYIQNVTYTTPILKKEQKIIVFCIDISGSMAGNRLEMVREACIKTINKMEKENPEYRVALITFQSVGRYYGDCTKPTVDTMLLENDLNLSTNQQNVKSLADLLLPIKTTHDMLVNNIKSLNASGGTCIRSALAQSVIIASCLPNSEVILCTDGAASDKSDLFYDSIIQYCNTNGFIKINIISFGEEDCDLTSLGNLAAQTKAKVFHTSDPLSFGEVFSCITNESLKSSLNGQVNLSILVSNGIKLDQNSQRLDIKSINKNEKEMLFEFFITSSAKHTEFVYFQFQLFYENSTRVITKKIKLGGVGKSKLESHGDEIHTDILHAFALRKLSKFILERNLLASKNFLNEYNKFMEETNESSENVNKIIELISNLNDSCSLNNEQAAIIQNNRNVCSFDIDCVKSIRDENVRSVNHNEIIDHFQENKKLLQDMFRFNSDETKKLNEYEEKLTLIFQKFNLDFLKSAQRDVNIRKLLAVIEMTEYAHNVVGIAKSIYKDVPFTDSVLKKEKIKEYQNGEEKNTDPFENLFEKISRDFSCFDSVFDMLKSKGVDCTKWLHEKVQQDLFINLNQFIYSDDLMEPNNDQKIDNLISTFDESSFRLIQKAKFCAKQTAIQQSLYKKRKDKKYNRSNLLNKQNSNEKKKKDTSYNNGKIFIPDGLDEICQNEESFEKVSILEYERHTVNPCLLTLGQSKFKT